MSPRIAVLPHKARATGLHVVATKGSGKSRTLGRVLSFSDIESNFPVVLFDPVGSTIDNLLDKLLRLTKQEQDALRLRERVVYVDIAGTGADGHVCPFRCCTGSAQTTRSTPSRCAPCRSGSRRTRIWPARP
jgi:hypothetical protein